MSALSTVVLAGATVEWLQWNSSYGNGDGEREISTRVRAEILAAPRRRVGKGSQVRVELDADESADLLLILDSIAGSGESMTSEERGSDAYAYRVIRRDAERIRDQLPECGSPSPTSSKTCTRKVGHPGFHATAATCWRDDR